MNDRIRKGAGVHCLLVETVTIGASSSIYAALRYDLSKQATEPLLGAHLADNAAAKVRFRASATSLARNIMLPFRSAAMRNATES